MKLDIFFKKIAKNFHFFSTKLPMAILLKKVKFVGNFFGGSDVEVCGGHLE